MASVQYLPLMTIIHIADRRMTKAIGFQKSPRSLERSLLVLLCIVLLLVLALGLFSELKEVNVIKYAHGDSYGHVKTKHQMEVLSWEPRVFLYHNFLAKNECEYLINIARPHMEKSTVVDSRTGRRRESSFRTSFSAVLRRGQDNIVSRIEQRIAAFAFIPEEHGEGIQILHYAIGQKYEPHTDFFFDQLNTKNGGQRIATMLMYLSDVEKGGETVFPGVKVESSSVPWWNELSKCGRSGLSVRPRMGDALLFWSMKPNATLDLLSLHGSCPVIQGDKWSATKWMRVNKYNI